MKKSKQAIQARLAWFAALDRFLELESYALLAEELGISPVNARLKVVKAIEVLRLPCETKADILARKDWIPVLIDDWMDIHIVEGMDIFDSYNRGVFITKAIDTYASAGYEKNHHVIRAVSALYDAGARFK